MVDEVEMTEALPSLADDGSGGACVEAARFGSSIGNGDGHGEGVTGDPLSSLKCTFRLLARNDGDFRDLGHRTYFLYLFAEYWVGSPEIC